MIDPSGWGNRLSLKEKIGQMLVVGFAGGVEGEEALRRVVSETQAGNVILFTRNAQDAATAARSASFARSLIGAETGIQPFVCIDQEGGIVARISRGVTALPGAMALSAGATPEEVRTLCAQVARDLCALGIDWNLGPVADVNVNPANPVIGVRSFGEDPLRVSEYARAWFEGMREGGVICCAKHFPGHGDTSVDSHLDLPEVGHTAERLESVELVPFVDLIGAGIPSILTAHVRFPAVEPQPLPATLSSAVIRGLLRSGLGFRGVVVTDCMEMKAIADHFPDAAVMAVEAGADMIMVSHTAELQIESARRIREAVLSGRIPESRIDEALGRILAMKDLASAQASPTLRDVALSSPSEPALAPAAAVELAARLSAQSLSPASAARFPELSRGGFYVDMLPAGFSRVEDAALGPAGPGKPGYEGAVDERAGGAPSSLFPDSILFALSTTLWNGCSLPARPSAEGVRSCLSRLEDFLAERAGLPVVFGLHNAASDPVQKELASEVRRRCAALDSPFACIATRSPYDARLFPDAACVCAYEYTALSARSVAAFLNGAIGATGHCPVTIAP